MFFFQPVLALLGFAVMAAGYALPGAYERLYFYYAYRLDHMTSENPTIATGCKGPKGVLCGLNEFMEYVSKTPIKVSVTTDKFPDVEKVAQEIHAKGLTGQIEPTKVIKDVKGGYAGLFKKVGERFVAKLNTGNFHGAATAQDFKDCSENGFKAMHSVFKARMEAAVDSFKPYGPEFKVVAPLREDGVPMFSPKKTAAANPDSDQVEIGNLWKKHIEGGHKENLATLNKNVEAAKANGLCLTSARRMAKRQQALFCGKFSIEDEIMLPKEIKLGKAAQMAEEISEKEFESLATKKGLKKIAEEKWKGKSLSEVRTMLKYEKLTPESPKVRVGKGGGFKAPSVAAGAAEVVGIGLWVYGIVEAWREGVSDLDLAASVTAIFPIIGCAVQSFSAQEQGAFDTIDSALCLLGDGLMITGNVLPGVALHVVRAILSFFRPPPTPKFEQMQAARDGIWNRFIRNDVYAYIYSHESYNNITGRRKDSTETEFRDKLESALAMESFAVISHGAQTIGAAVGSAQDSLEASTTDEEKAGVEKGIENVKTELTEATDKEIVRRQRELLISLPKALKEKHEVSLGPMAKELNNKFIDNVTSSEMVGKYAKWLYMGPGAATQDNSDEVEQQLYDIGEALADNPPALPQHFDLAYVLGQSQGLKTLHNETLSVEAYLREKFATLPEATLQLHVLHHTLQIARLLQGELTEDQLSTEFPTTDAQGVRDLQTLIALKYGRMSDESKLWCARQNYPGGLWSLMINDDSERDIRIIINPYIPTRTPLLTGPNSIFLTIGLSDAIVQSLMPQVNELSARAEPKFSQDMINMAKKLADAVAAPNILWPALVAEQKRRDAEEAAFLAAPAAPAADDKPKRALPRSAAAYRASFAAAAA